MASFTPYQLVVLILLVVCKFLSTILWSLQAPFYPAEAEKKNATHLESGLVLGSYEIMVFIMCPLISILLPRIGAFRCFHIGLITCAISTILFGFLDKVDGRIEFVVLSLILRLFEASGGAAVFIAMYTLANRLYPGSIATVFGIIESTFAIGMAAGPPLGGILFEFGNSFGDYGFTTPFLTVGILMLLTSIATFTIFPKEPVYENENGKSKVGITESTTEIMESESESPNFGFFSLLKVRNVILYSMAGICASICVGFLTGTLEPHLRQFDLTPSLTGMLFLTYGGVYAATGFIWGILCDRLRRPEILTLVASVLVLISFTFIGPVSWIPLSPSVALTGTSLAIFGLGLGGLYVSVYTLLLKEASRNGFPESSRTSALVAGLWMEGISLGAFLGPIIGGILLHHFSFADSTLSIIAIFLMLAIVLALSIFTTEGEDTKDSKSKSVI